MPTYQYKAMTKNGRVVKNTISGMTKAELVKKLKKNDLVPIDIQQAVNFGTKDKYKARNHKDAEAVLKDMSPAQIDLLYNNRNKKEKVSTYQSFKSKYLSTQKITKRDVMVFTQSFLLLKKADFNNIHALQTVIQSTENPSLRGVLEDILSGVEGGDYMYTTMEYYENVFPVIYTNMIKVGELSGSLVKSLEQALAYLDSNDALVRKVKKIIIPNLIQFVGMILLLIIGTLYAIPSIQEVFDAVGSQEELPAPTMWFSNFLDKALIWWYVPAGIILAVIVAIVVYVHTPVGKYKYHYFKYTMPIFGPLIYALDFSRVMKAVTLNIKNGMRIQQALEVSKNVIRNNVMMSIVESSINNIMIGQSWVTPFEEAGFGNRMTTEMLKVGMQTDLGAMLDKLLEYVEMDIDNILQKIMKVLPEISYSIVGVVLVFFVVVVLVPCIQVYMGSFLFNAYL